MFKRDLSSIFRFLLHPLSLCLVLHSCPLSGIFGISSIFAMSESTRSHSGMWLSSDRLCRVIKMNAYTQMHKHRHEECMEACPQECAAHVLTLFYERCPGAVAGDKPCVRACVCHVCVMCVLGVTFCTT